MYGMVRVAFTRAIWVWNHGMMRNIEICGVGEHWLHCMEKREETHPEGCYVYFCHFHQLCTSIIGRWQRGQLVNSTTSVSIASLLLNHCVGLQGTSAPEATSSLPRSRHTDLSLSSPFPHPFSHAPPFLSSVHQSPISPPSAHPHSLLSANTPPDSLSTRALSFSL